MAEIRSSKSAIVPDKLRTAIASGRCVLFVGAGASMDAVDRSSTRLPHWGLLLVELLNLIQESADPDPEEVVIELQNMVNSSDFMSISEWIERRLGPSEFRRHLIDRLVTAKYSRVHEILSSKPFRAVMTTNYDRLIEIHWQKQDRNPFVVVPQDPSKIALAIQILGRPEELTPIMRVHGSLSEPETLIFFPRSYRSIMFNNEPFRQFVSNVFQNYTILFVGTSFRDPNLQSFMQWIYTITEGQQGSHFAILDDKGPVFRYYMKKNYNIDFITYSAPNGDHSKLLQILESL